MKILSRFLSLIFAVILISSCSSNNDVVSCGIFVKHKHRSGFHLNAPRQASLQETKAATATKNVTQLNESFALAAPTPEKNEIESPKPSERRKARSASASAEIKSSPVTIRRHFEARKGRLKMEESHPDEVNGNKFNKASKTQRRGRWALFFAFLQGACWLINLSSFLIALSPTILLINALFFLLFCCLAIGLGWKIKKRNDAAKWAVILAFGFIIFNVAISVIGSIIGVIVLA
ncbi:MAG: hypothetical protein RLP15_02815 [Cryomorphaceae bacterium]